MTLAAPSQQLSPALAAAALRGVREARPGEGNSLLDSVSRVSSDRKGLRLLNGRWGRARRPGAGRPSRAGALAWLALALSGCAPEGNAAQADAPTAETGGLSVASELPDHAFVRLGTLPPSPETAPVADHCSQYAAAPESPAAQVVAKAGWIVTSEAPLAGFTVVSFASGFDPGTSARCFARNANIAVFKGEALVALAYRKPPPDGEPEQEGYRAPLGPVVALEDASGLLVFTDPPGAPIGELKGDAKALRLTARSPRHAFCGGKAVVPDIYDMGIDRARKLLLAQGWTPELPAEAPNQYDLAHDMALRGLIEAETCSGTGVGYCAWHYRGKAGRLGVTTVGGTSDPADNIVVGYGVLCEGG
jgi:hypothetical protein